ncbi:hypothetical protein ACGLHR_12890 [Cupriavidus sp. CuC1]
MKVRLANRLACRAPVELADAEDQFVLRHPVHPLVAVEQRDRPVLLLIEDVEAFPPGQDGAGFHI